jgi:hypothetical protein
VNNTQYYTLIAVPLVGILMNAGLYIYVASRIDTLIAVVKGIDK